MRKKRGWRRAAALALSAVLLAGTALALYDAIWPQQSGTDVLTSKSLVVDAGNAAQGYILARGKANKKRLKLRVTQGQYKLTYDLNTAGNTRSFRFSSATAATRWSCLKTSPAKIRRGGQGDGAR